VAAARERPGYTDGQYPNNIEGESPHSGNGQYAVDRVASARLGDYVTAHAEFAGGPLPSPI